MPHITLRIYVLVAAAFALLIGLVFIWQQHTKASTAETNHAKPSKTLPKEHPRTVAFATLQNAPRRDVIIRGEPIPSAPQPSSKTSTKAR